MRRRFPFGAADQVCPISRFAVCRRYPWQNEARQQGSIVIERRVCRLGGEGDAGDCGEGHDTVHLLAPLQKVMGQA